MAISNAKFRKKRINFTMVSNAALRDEKLSLKAKGLYSIIQSYITLEDFDIYKSTLYKVCKEGEKAFEGAWQELKETGYLKQYRIRTIETDDKGEVIFNGFKYEYELLDEPDINQPKLINIGLDGEIILKNEQKFVLPQNGGGTKIDDSCTPPISQGVQPIDGTEVGQSINTDINNTYSLNQSIYHNNTIFLKQIDMIDYKKIIAKNIEYDSLKQIYGKQDSIAENIYNIIIDTLEDTTAPTLKFAGQTIATDKVKEKLLQLNHWDVRYVIDCFEEVRDTIKSIDKYLLRCLYNAHKTNKAYYTNLVHSTTEY